MFFINNIFVFYLTLLSLVNYSFSFQLKDDERWLLEPLRGYQEFLEAKIKPKVLWNFGLQNEDFNNNFDATSSWNQSFRLNPNVIPLRYDIVFQPNITLEYFSGNVTIEVKVRESIEEFIVHAGEDLNISKSLVTFNKKQLKIESESRYMKYELYIVKLHQKVTPGLYHLFYEFKGPLKVTKNGLYKSNYKLDNKTIGLAATQFEPAYARKAFPCFDEPQMKAIFKVRIIHELHHTANSNMNPIKVSRNSNGLLTTEFNESMKMSSYLLALVVSDFQCINGSVDNIQVSTCAQPKLLHKLDYSLEKAKDIIHYLNEYFQIKFPLPKIDHISIPDFLAGAMENWGLILYQDYLLAYHENDATTAQKMQVTSVIAHESAHQWHGNLVTLKWWDNLWLNEGFADFMFYKAVIKSEPTWDYDHHFIYRNWIEAIITDSSEYSSPISKPVITPIDIGFISSIVYTKGSSIIRMLEFMMGKESFRKGIHNYLNKHKYNNTITQNLWDDLDEQYNRHPNLTQIMNKWIVEKGFPYVNLTKINSHHSKTHQYKVVQERFFQTGRKSTNDTWTIPLSYLNKSNQYHYDLIDSKEKKITVSLNNNLPKFNVEASGFYLVNYDAEDWKTLTKSLLNNASLLTPSDRANLLVDSTFLSRAKLLNVETALNLTLYLTNEQHFVSWKVGYDMIGYLFMNLEFSNEFKVKLKKYKNLISEKQFERLGWTDDGDDNTKMLRMIIIELACSSGNKKCLDGAKAEFKKMKNGQQIKPNLVSLVTRYGVAQNEYENWEFLWKEYLETNVTEEKIQYLRLLSMSKNETIIKRFLNNSLNEKIVSKQHIPLVLYLVSINDNSISWDFYKDNYLLLNKTLGVDRVNFIGNLICRTFFDEKDKQKVNDLFTLYKMNEINDYGKKQLIKTIDENIKLVKEDIDIAKWLKNL